MTYTREQLLEKLHKGPCTVTFTKVNGETRVMPCTLAEGLLPPAPVKEHVTERKENTSVIRVFCLDKREWRSFRVDSVTEVKDE